MPEMIINASGPQYGLVVNPDGSINTAQVETPSDGNNYHTDLIYIVSGALTGVTGSEIGSIVKFFGTGSYVQVLTYSNNALVSVGSWS